MDNGIERGESFLDDYATRSGIGPMLPVQDDVDVPYWVINQPIKEPAAVISAEQPTAPHRFHLMTANDLAALPRPHWRVRGVLPETGLAAIFGPSGSGKGFLVLDLAQALAEGKDWFGYRVNQCPVVYCALEGEAGIPVRVSAYRAKNGAISEQVRYMAQPFNLLFPADVAALADAIHAAGCDGGVLFIDTLNRAAPNTNENDSQDMGRVITAAAELQAAVGGLVVLVHHTGKDAARGLRGHSSLYAALDAVIEVTRDGENRAWGVHKSKDGQDGATKSFRLETVDVAIEDDGTPITSCVVAPSESVGESIRRVVGL